MVYNKPHDPRVAKRRHSSYLSTSLKVSLDFPVLHSIDHQLENQIRTLDLHVQLKIQIREFLAFAGRQSGEQALRHRRQIRSELTDAYQVLVVGVWCIVVFASNEIVFDNQRLAWSEIASVMEGYGLFRRDWRALDTNFVSSSA